MRVEKAQVLRHFNQGIRVGVVAILSIFRLFLCLTCRRVTLRHLLGNNLCSRIVVALLHLLDLGVVEVPEKQSIVLTVCSFVLDRKQGVLQVLKATLQTARVLGRVCHSPGLLVGFLLLFDLGFARLTLLLLLCLGDFLLRLL